MIGTQMTRTIRTTFAATCAVLLLGGCVSLGGSTPDTLLTLRAEAAPAANMARTGTPASALTVLVPNVPQKLRTPRIPVQADATNLAYVEDAQWVDAPARLFQRLLSETIAARTDRLVLDESQYVTGPGDVLSGELLEFGVDVPSGQAVVVYQAMRLTGDGRTIAQRRFEAREAVSPVEAGPVGIALNRAANRVAADVAGWVQ
jgi:cholesterol transport system auxiliary component